MVYKLRYKAEFFKALDRIDKKSQKRIIAGLEKLRDNFTACDVKKLKNTKTYRYRIGNYRILFQIQPETREFTIILILTIGHRKDIYK